MTAEFIYDLCIKKPDDTIDTLLSMKFTNPVHINEDIYVYDSTQCRDALYLGRVTKVGHHNAIFKEKGINHTALVTELSQIPDSERYHSFVERYQMTSF